MSNIFLMDNRLFHSVYDDRMIVNLDNEKPTELSFFMTRNYNIIMSQSSQRIKRNVIYKIKLTDIHSWQTHAKKLQIIWKLTELLLPRYILIELNWFPRELYVMTLLELFYWY